MKKLLLFIILLFSNSVLFAQTLNQPSVSNNQCGTSANGGFNILDISAEILAGLNPNNYSVTHYLTQSDAVNAVNPLVPPIYYNPVNPQQIFVRVVNTVTSQVQYMAYLLQVNPIPVSNPQMVSECDPDGDGFASFDLDPLYPVIIGSQPNMMVTFHETQIDAQNGTNAINSPYGNLMPQQTIYYRHTNAVTGCFSISTVALITANCQPGAGYPVHLTQCVDSNNAQACFDLASNNSNIMGSLNPSAYTITYYNSPANAQNGVNALASPYCIVGSQIIYASLENDLTEEFQIFNFNVISQTVSNTITLANVEQCDDNNDGTVIFNLTNIAAQINTANPLTYYANAIDATTETNAIANPSAFTVGSQNTVTDIFVRETITNACDSIYTFQVRAFPNCNLASSCSLGNSLCNALGVPFVNSINTAINETGANYGCLGSHPNPTWFYLPVSGSGTINLQVSQVDTAGTPRDVDYIVYGPFASPVTPCSGQLTTNNIVSCSFSAAAVEYPVIPNAQPGQYYLIMTTNYSNLAGFITITELATTQGTISCSGFRLNAFLDTNNNSTKDLGEPNFPLGEFHYELNNNGVVHNVVSPFGVYNIYETNNTTSYDISYTLDPSYGASYGITTSSYTNVTAVIGAGMQTYNFPITATQTYNDLAVIIVPFAQPRPGFTYQNRVVYANLGNQTIPSGTVTFNKDALVTITANTQTGTISNVGGFTYNFTNLLPFEVRMMTVTMQVPTLPTVSIGNYLTNSASIAPLAGDVVPENNTSESSQMIIGAYDPNDKMESHGEQILFSSFASDEYLYYTIRFENTGNASAINVRITDVLDDKLDENSIKVISASHGYIMDRVANNLTWRFDNIQLPAVAQNPTGGKGYVMFKVKLKPGFAVGDIIPNTASIYFDFNPAIITNTFETEFVSMLAVDQFENGNFVFYPNPASDIVTISLKNNADAISNVTVYDVMGKVILNKKMSNAMTTETIDLSAATNGIYFLEVTTANNLKVVKKLMVN